MTFLSVLEFFYNELCLFTDSRVKLQKYFQNRRLSPVSWIKIVEAPVNTERPDREDIEVYTVVKNITQYSFSEQTIHIEMCYP